MISLLFSWAVFRSSLSESFFKVSSPGGISGFSSMKHPTLWSFAADCVDTGTPRKEYKESNKSYAAFKLFTSDEEWVHDTIRKLTTWGFNSTGGWSDDDAFRKFAGSSRLPYFVVLHLGACDLAPWHDLFDRAMELATDGAAKKLIPKVANDPYLVGYFSDNELGWWDDTLFLNYLKLKPSAPGRKKLIETLRHFYHESFNGLKRDWIVKGDDFNHIKDLHLRPGGTGRKALDAFTEALGKRYYSLMRETIRRYDKNHLILGDRYCQYYTLPIVRASKPYVDVVSTNFGADWNDGSIAPFFLRTLHTVTDKPVVVTEFYMCATENRSGNKNGSTAFPVVQTQMERAAAFAKYVRAVASLPYTVGAHWFQYTDEPAKGRGDGENFNMGFLDTDGRPYEEMVAACQSLNLSALRKQAHDLLPRTDVSVPWVSDPSLTSLKVWPREQGVLPVSSGTPFGDMFVCQDKENVYLALFAMDYMDESLYAGGHIPQIDRNRWQIHVTGLEKPLDIHYGGKDQKPTINMPGIEIHQSGGLKVTVTLKIPKQKLQHAKSVAIRAELNNHGHSQTMNWKAQMNLEVAK